MASMDSGWMQRLEEAQTAGDHNVVDADVQDGW